MISGKTCLDCKQHKQIIEFYSTCHYYKKKNRRESEYIHYSSRCKPCHSKHIAELRLNRKDYYKKKRKEYFKNSPSARSLAKKHCDRWEKKNPEKVKENRKRYYLENRERMIAIAAQWRMDNHSYCLKYQRDYYQENKKSILRKARRHYFDNRERILARQKERRMKMKLLKDKK